MKISLQETIDRVVDIEINGIRNLQNSLGDELARVVETILKTSGKVIVCGMGKSGIIGQKIAASFASTGTSSFFMHPG